MLDILDSWSSVGGKRFRLFWPIGTLISEGDTASDWEIERACMYEKGNTVRVCVCACVRH